MSKYSRRQAIRKAKTFALGTLIGALATLALIPHPGLTSPNPSSPAKVAAVAEDSPQWDCTTMGNRVCAPGNSQAVPAGMYDVYGVLSLSWDEYVEAMYVSEGQTT